MRGGTAKAALSGQFFLLILGDPNGTLVCLVPDFLASKTTDEVGRFFFTVMYVVSEGTAKIASLFYQSSLDSLFLFRTKLRGMTKYATKTAVFGPTGSFRTIKSFVPGSATQVAQPLIRRRAQGLRAVSRDVTRNVASETGRLFFERTFGSEVTRVFASVTGRD